MRGLIRRATVVAGAAALVLGVGVGWPARGRCECWPDQRHGRWGPPGRHRRDGPGLRPGPPVRGWWPARGGPRTCGGLGSPSSPGRRRETARRASQPGSDIETFTYLAVGSGW